MLLATVAVAVAVMWSARGGSRDEVGSAPKREPSSGAVDRGASVASSKIVPSTAVVKDARASATTQANGGAVPATGATTQGVGGKGAPGAPAAFVLPPEFAIFQTRSPFGKGPKKPATAAAGPEATFVLKGAVDVGGRLTAFIEDLGAKRVMQVAVGEPIARGKVKTITLDSIEYEAAGVAAKRIAVGQNLMGVVVPPTPTSKPAGSPGSPGQPGGPQPGVPGQPMPPGAAPGQPVRVQVVK
jgi:hypothetical protein